MAVSLGTASETMTSISRSTPSSTTPNLSPTTLPGLLPELILEIFESVDSFPTALALSHTCHRLHSIWTVNADAIFPSIVDCFPQAQELARAQADACARPGTGTSVPPRPHLSTAQRISRNAVFASRILDRFEKRVVRESARRGSMRGALTSVEGADFVRAAYRAMTLAASGQRGIPHWLLERLDMLAYMQLREAVDFLNSCLHGGRTESKVAALFPRSLDAFAAVSWASLDLTLFHLDLMQLPVDHGGFRCWGKVPFDYFTVADGYQAKAGSARGARMADLLPLLAGIGFFARQERFSL